MPGPGVGQLPMFPLNTVVFPGISVPLEVSDNRYRAMVNHLLTFDDPSDRVFGAFAIREGYEIGHGSHEKHGAQSLYRIGCRLHIDEITPHTDGSLTLQVSGLDRIVLDGLDTSGDFPVGNTHLRPECIVPVPTALVTEARETFARYRDKVRELRSDPFAGTLPASPALLSWALAACALLPLPDRQQLLETHDAEERLGLVTALLEDELSTMSVVPSLPASDIARTRWCPN